MPIYSCSSSAVFRPNVPGISSHTDGTVIVRTVVDDNNITVQKRAVASRNNILELIAYLLTY